MKLRAFRFLADENFDPEATSFLRDRNCDVVSVTESGLMGRPDVDVLRAAHEAGRVVLTHDRDFGTLAIVARQPLVGIAFIRPGHISSELTCKTLEVLVTNDPEVNPPFILVARQRDGVVTIRIRKL